MVDNVKQPIGSGSGPSHKKRWIVIGVAVFVLLGLSGYFLFKALSPSSIGTTNKNGSQAAQKVQAKAVCSDDIIREASGPIGASDQETLGAVVDKITALKDYDLDPNCLYITLQYSIAAGDATTSSAYLGKLEQVYNSAVGFSGAFTVKLASIATLRENVAFITQNAKDNTASSDAGNKTTADGSQAADKFQEEHKQ